MTRLGLARATTKEIARAAGCSEALLYKHFREKEEIFLGVLKNRLPSFTADPGRAARPGRHRLRTGPAGRGGRRRRPVLRGGLAIGSSMLGDPELVRRHREWMLSRGVGPQLANRMLADYLRAEQKAGRVAAGGRRRRGGGAAARRQLPAGVHGPADGRAAAQPAGGRVRAERGGRGPARSRSLI